MLVFKGAKYQSLHNERYITLRFLGNTGREIGKINQEYKKKELFSTNISIYFINVFIQQCNGR